MMEYADRLREGMTLADGRIIEYVSTHDGKTFIRTDVDTKVWPTSPNHRFEVK